MSDDEYKYLTILLIVILGYLILKSDLIEGATDVLQNASAEKPATPEMMKNNEMEKCMAFYNNSNINDQSRFQIRTMLVKMQKVIEQINKSTLGEGEKTKMIATITADTNLKLTKIALQGLGINPNI